VRLLLALTMSLMASMASAAGVVPEAAAPDVVYIGDGWPASLTNGCADRGECQLPDLPKTVRHAYPAALPGKSGFGGGRDCTGAAQGVGDIRTMFDAVSRCIGG